MDWYERAAEAGDVPSMVALGELLSDGFSPRQDPAKSYRWLRLASEGGHAVSVLRAQRVKQRLTPAQVELEERRIRRLKHRIFVSGEAGVGRP